MAFILLSLGFAVLFRKLMWRFKITITGLLLLIAYKLIEAVSYHLIDQFLMRSFVFINTFNLIELSILGLVLLGTFVEFRTKKISLE